MITQSGILPSPQMSWAWFFDFDGTLVEIASHPARVVVHKEINSAIELLHQLSGGAVSIVTGRAISDIDPFLALPHLAVSGQHGLELRTANGEVTLREVAAVPLEKIKEELRVISQKYPGLVLEEKSMSIALHYRLAPQLAGYAHRIMRSIQKKHAPHFVLQKGKKVVELKPAGTDKGDVIRHLMKANPFKGRLPVFIGDDITDEAGFRAVNELGGYSIKVGRGRTSARYRMNDVAQVRKWLVEGIVNDAAPQLHVERDR